MEGDVLLAFISSQTYKKGKHDLFLDINDKDFKNTGLKQDSLIKLDKLITLNKKIIIGKIGWLSQEKISEINIKLKLFLEL